MDPNSYGYTDSQELQEKPLRDILKQLGSDTGLLVRQEIELFKKELGARLDRVERNVTVLGAGAVLAFVGVLALTAALILALSGVMDAWLAAGLVGVAYLVAGGIAWMRGKNKLTDNTVVPEQSIQSVKKDVRTVREAMT